MEVLRWGYQIPFHWAPTLSRDPIPLPAYAPSSIRGKALEGEVQALLNKGAIELAPLPSPGFYSRLFVVMKASGAWRPVIDLSTLNLRIQQTSFKMETLQSVLFSVRPGLDGVSGLEGCVLAGANAPGFMQVPQVHGGGEGVPVQGTLLRPFHGSASFYQGHGSCVSDSTQDGGTTSSLPGRLVASGILTRAGSPCSEDSAATLQAPRDCRQLGEVSGDSDSTDGISGSHPGLYCFQVFSCPEENREASLNWRRILVLRQSASVILAGVIRGAVLNDPTRSWGSPLHEATPADSSASVGSDRSVSAGRVVTGNSRRSFLVARPRSLSAWRFSGAGVPSARVMVRRLGRGLEGSLG